MTLRLAWYGDDFTGATDTLRVAATAGLRSLLFLDVPTAEQLARAGQLDALGIAGAARAMSPPQMKAELARIGQFFFERKAPVFHYKCCSTFDSSPAIGSIGAAAAILGSYVGNPATMLVGGQPDIGRFCCFGNLFALAGAGGEVCRLDRHPTMKDHPVTPMGEADLRRHIGLQGLAPISGIAYTEYGRGDADLDRLVDARLGGRDEVRALLFDVADASHLLAVGRQLDRQSRRGSVLAMGSSVVVQALAAWWNRQEGGGVNSATVADIDAKTTEPPCRGPVFALAGSMSPVTALQVARADSYERIPLSGASLLGDPAYAGAQSDHVAALLDRQKHVLAYVENTDGQPTDIDARQLAFATADFIKRVVDGQAAKGRPLRRLGVAGGDTSSRAAKALDIWALSFVDVLAPGVALCQAHSDDHRLHGMQLMLKGGQMGGDDIFERLLLA